MALAAILGICNQASVQEAAAPNNGPPAMTLTLEQAKQHALGNNKQLQLGRMNIEAAGFAVKAARTDYFPKVLGSGYYLHFNDDLGTVISGGGRRRGGQTIDIQGRGPLGLGAGIQLPQVTIPATTREVAVLNEDTAIGILMVAQPITKLIGVSALVEIARADEAVAAAKLDQGTTDLLSGVTQAYYGLLAARRVETALTLQAEMLESVLKAQSNVELRLGLLEIRKGLAETQKQIADLNDLLVNLLGLPPCTRLELVEPALTPVSVTGADQAAELAVAGSAQIREAEQDIFKARAGLRAARMDYIPDVNVIGGVAAQSAADYIQEGFSFAGLQASYTFLDWGKRHQVKFQRQTQMAMAVKNVEVMSETVRQDARKAYTAYKQAEEELGIANEVVKARLTAAEEAREPAAVATAKAAAAKAQLDQMQAELNYRLAHAKLLAAIGQP